MAFALTSEREKRVEDILTRYPDSRAALLPTLWLCQEQNGWVSPDVIDFVAERLSLPTAAVKGVVTFYTMFFEEPVGEHVIWVCRTISCDLRGGKAIQEHLEKRLDCKAGGTSKDGRFTLLKAECLAACGQAPMVQINDLYYENLDTEVLDRIIDEHLEDPKKGKLDRTHPPKVNVAPRVSGAPSSSSGPGSVRAKRPSAIASRPSSASSSRPSSSLSSGPSSPSSEKSSAPSSQPGSFRPPLAGKASDLAVGSAAPRRAGSVEPSDEHDEHDEETISERPSSAGSSPAEPPPAKESEDAPVKKPDEAMAKKSEQPPRPVPASAEGEQKGAEQASEEK